MFGFVTGRKPSPIHARLRLVGLDLTAARARAVSVGSGKTRSLQLDATAEELRLMVHLDRRPPEVGRAAVATLRRTPHAVAVGFLPLIGQPRTWAAGRSTLTPESAMSLVFERLRAPVVAESDAAALVLPGYLNSLQVAKLVELAAKAKLPIRGTASAALAIAAHRARTIPSASSEEDEVPVGSPDRDGAPRGNSSLPTDSDWDGPDSNQNSRGASVVIVDADDTALTASVVAMEPEDVRLVGFAAWPKLSLRVWMDRLIDGMSDRCVRVCRRDPRDSADAEQAMFDQLSDALDLSAHGHSVTLTVRSAHWYQDLTHRPTEFDAYCTTLANTAADNIREVVWSAGLSVPPRVVWLTAAAARLPGLGTAIYRSSPESTTVDALPETAAAEAAASLAVRWQAGSLPRMHLDVSIPMEPMRESPMDEPLPEVPYAERAPRAMP